ncbi:dnaJ homolog subfamily C member 17 [Ischnura elegans]|uniref:dnaJ homolog subfamily C member 17 n=1 Tax=Ischnura elegans TaxID=197161 RepID=UPI001ED8B77F|nr:dnaJ homolog subfamily C member 17 [Ischnura elegans]
MGDIKVTEMDLYELLGIDQNCTSKEIKTAYRKKALSCHPDKNPDDAKAAERFHTLSKALEILIDASARAAYDKVFNAKKIAKARHNQLDARRKKLKEDLEAREQASMKGPSVVLVEPEFSKTKSDEEKLLAEVERLRKQGSRELKEEIERVNKQVEEEWKNLKKNFHANFRPIFEPEDAKVNDCRLRLRWDIENGKPVYDEESLRTIFTKYGPITAIVIASKQKKKPSKKGSGIIEFDNSTSAEAALQKEKGFLENPLTIEFLIPRKNAEEVEEPDVLSEKLTEESVTQEKSHFPSVVTSFSSFHPSKVSTFPAFSSGGAPSTVDDFESLVLRRMRQAQERKRLEEEIKAQENESS